MSSSNAPDSQRGLLQRHSDRFAERNLPLLALLGLVRASDDLEDYVARLCENSEQHAHVPASEDEAQAIDKTVLIALGLIAVSRKFRATVADWARAKHAQPAARAVRSPRRALELLR